MDNQLPPDDQNEDLLPETSLFVFADATELDRLNPELPSLDSLSRRYRFAPGAGPTETGPNAVVQPDSGATPAASASTQPPESATPTPTEPPAAAQQSVRPAAPTPPSLIAVPDLDRPIKGGAASNALVTPPPERAGTSIPSSVFDGDGVDKPPLHQVDKDITRAVVPGDLFADVDLVPADRDADFLSAGRRSDSLIGVLAIGLIVAVVAGIGSWFVFAGGGSTEDAIDSVRTGDGAAEVQALVDQATAPLPFPTAQFVDATPTPLPTSTPLPTPTAVPTATPIPATPVPVVDPPADEASESDTDSTSAGDTTATDSSTDSGDTSTESDDTASATGESDSADTGDDGSDAADSNNTETTDDDADQSDDQESTDGETGEILTDGDNNGDNNTDNSDTSDGGVELATGLIQGRSSEGQDLDLTIDPSTGSATFTGVTEAAPTTGGIGDSGDIAAIETHMVDTINAVRSAAGAAPLATSSGLMTPSAQWAATMSSSTALVHCGGCAQAPIPATCTAWAENIGQGSTIELIEKALEQSPRHYANMVNAQFTQVGVGVSYSDGLWWVTHTFGVNC